MTSLRDASGGRLLIAGLGLVLVAMAAVAGGYVTRSHGHATLPASTSQAGIETVRGVVQSRSGDSLTLLTESGPVTLKISGSTRIESIEGTALASVKPGDWVNAGGVPHAQTIFALTALVVIPSSELQEGR